MNQLLIKMLQTSLKLYKMEYFDDLLLMQAKLNNFHYIKIRNGVYEQSSKKINQCNKLNNIQ
jgi:hypothetical protein